MRFFPCLFALVASPAFAAATPTPAEIDAGGLLRVCLSLAVVIALILAAGWVLRRLQGGTVGAGIEVGFAPNWSVAFEYDHLFMGNHNITFPATAIAVSRADNIRQDVDLATVRVNYRWGGPVIAKY